MMDQLPSWHPARRTWSPHEALICMGPLELRLRRNRSLRGRVFARFVAVGSDWSERTSAGLDGVLDLVLSSLWSAVVQIVLLVNPNCKGIHMKKQ